MNSKTEGEEIRGEIEKFCDSWGIPDSMRGEWRDLFSRLLSSKAKEIGEKLELMKKIHREFECNGANKGKGCYETWCEMETCISQDALICKTINSSMNAAQSIVKEVLINNKI
jgi:hypothetical protein